MDIPTGTLLGFPADKIPNGWEIVRPIEGTIYALCRKV